MKISQITLVIALTVFMISCGGDNKKDQITGEWTLTAFSNNGETIELTDCDQQTKWVFSTEQAEALGDGTSVQKLTASAPESCKYYGFDAKWTVTGGQLFISTSRIGGMGGNSLAGLMKIKEITPNKMIVTSMKKELTFER